MSIEPNLMRDIWLLTKEINIRFENRSVFNYKTYQMEPFSRLHYSANLYKRNDGSKYYIFKEYNDCTLFIIDCEDDEFDELKKYIELSNGIEIWQPFNDVFQLIHVIDIDE